MIGGRILMGAALSFAALAPNALAAGGGYHSPGYAGSTGFKNVVPAPLPSIVLGTGKNPRLLVDQSGTAHIVYAQDGGATSADTLAYCNLQRGIKRCATGGLAPNLQAPDPSLGGDFAGNFPAGNHDTDGPVPLAIGNELFVIDRRFPDTFTTPGGGTSQSNVFEWSSADGGQTLTGPGMLGTNQMAGGAIAYGDPAFPSIGTISASQTDGTFFQGTAPGQYAGTSKAQLGSGSQDYDGSLALDGQQPVAAFADLSGNIFVREYSGQGDVNDAANWSQSSFHGFSPQLVGGAAGTFVLYSHSQIGGGTMRLARVNGGQITGAPVALGRSHSQPAISEDPTGRIALAYTDNFGVETESSSDGVHFSPPQLAALIPAGQGVEHLQTASTFDGGGFVAFVKNATGAEAVGQVTLAAFGTQKATGRPGLGPLPGGGIGSQAGDQLASSTCARATFGVVTVTIPGAASCFAHAPGNPNLDVSLGEVDINGIRIIPDAGARIGIDPRQHTIDTTGKVRIVLSAPGIADITLWHDELHAKIPDAIPGAELFDLHEGKAEPLVEGFPIDGGVDIKLANGGVDIPISLTLPGSFGGVTGQATLHASTSTGLTLSSLEFTVGDADLGAIELKNVDVTYAASGTEWDGKGTLNVPSGGGALSATVSVKFTNGHFAGGSLDVGLDYPGVPLDESDPPPQLYLSHGGLGFDLGPPTLSGTIGFGVTPLAAPGAGGPEDYIFRLEGQLSAAFGSPVTITVSAQGFLYNVELTHATLVYKIPDQVTLTGAAAYRLGLLRFTGNLGAIIDPEHKLFGAKISAKAFLVMPDPFGDVPLPSGFAFAVNNRGFGAYVGLPGIYVPAPPPGGVFFGTISYQWGDSGPKIFYAQNMTGRFTSGIPGAADRGYAAAGAFAFTVPSGAPSASVIVRGQGGAPSITLTAPGGQQLALDGKTHARMRALALAGSGETDLGISHPRAGRWSVSTAPGSPVAVSSISYSIGEPPPTLQAHVTGAGQTRTLRYRARLPGGVSVRFAEQTSRLLHVIGAAHNGSGAIRFTPASGPAGRRQIVAQIADNGIATAPRTLGSYLAPKPARPGAVKRLRVRSTRRAFTFTFRSPQNAAHVLVRIVTSDGRHLHRLLKAGAHAGSLAVIGFKDAVTVTVTGVGADGRRGPSASASAKRKL
jgi:hypothetical protein